MVKAENLIKQFTKQEKVGRKTEKITFNAVNGISVTAYDGETLGILGPNGAGKTTLLRMLGTLMEPTSGSVCHYNKEGKQLSSSEEVKSILGYLSNNTKLYEKFSLREFLTFVGQAHDMTSEKIEERINVVNEALNLSEFMDNKIKSLSTGQTQRASIARCLFSDPDMYILDEPTLGLDIMSASAIVNFMKAEKAAGKTIIYSTHYLEEAEKLCDRIILVNKGHIIGEGTPSELMESKNVSTLREAFLKYIEEDGGEQ